MTKILFPLIALALVAACEKPVGSGCEEPAPIRCRDALIESLSLSSEGPSPQGIENESMASGFLSTIDARAGGLVADPKQSYLYAKFSDEGLEKVELSDLDALDSMDWDIAFHRYIIRLNGGSSGPSCVAASVEPGIAESGYVLDDQFDEECVFRGDSEALDAARERDWRLALGVPDDAYYEYNGCVEMTGQRFVFALANARHVAFEVKSFYNEAAQDLCDESGSTNYAGAATIKAQWEFLD